VIFATRLYRFPASHRLHSPDLSDAENARLYGKCNNPYGHGHDYLLEVTASGGNRERSGLVFRRSALDRLVADKVLSRFAYRDINRDVEQFANLVPTTENVALVVAGLLEQHWSEYLCPGAVLHRVRLRETPRNTFEVVVSAAPASELRRIPTARSSQS
jgi:6-pyruvoyltetrahydropterin/6-carboxytetrahydropterin synthase